MNLSNQQLQQQDINPATNSTFPINMQDYEQASSSQIIVEFARNSYPLAGAVIQGNTIRGEFGHGEIQQPRNERLILLQNRQLKSLDKVSKIIIIKSLLNSKKHANDNRLPETQNINHHNPPNQKPINSPEQNKQLTKFKNSHSSLVQVQNIPNLQPDNNIDKKSEQHQAQEEERFFSESSESSQVEQRQRRQAKDLLKKKQSISKSSNNKKPSKLNKNILKKKLKYLAQKK